MIVEFRRRTPLPLDDVLGCLRDRIPKLTRPSLHRCLERHGISRLPDNDKTPAKRGRVADTPIGYVHIDICGLCLAEGKLHMFLAIDRVSKFVCVEFHDQATKLIEAFDPNGHRLGALLSRKTAAAAIVKSPARHGRSTTRAARFSQTRLGNCRCACLHGVSNCLL